MKLIDDWKRVLLRAWCVRWMLAAGLCATVEAVLPTFSDSIPRGVFAVLTLVSILGGIGFRVLAQDELKKTPIDE